MLVKFNFNQNSRTRTTRIAGHLTVVSACSGGHLTNYFFKSQIPWGFPGGGGLIAVGFDSYIRVLHRKAVSQVHSLPVCLLAQNKVHRRLTSWFFQWFSYNFGVTRNSSSNADAMVLASAHLRGIHPPDNIQNGGCPGGECLSNTQWLGGNGNGEHAIAWKNQEVSHGVSILMMNRGSGYSSRPSVCLIFCAIGLLQVTSCICWLLPFWVTNYCRFSSHFTTRGSHVRCDLRLFPSSLSII
jgi:hypothetical protein